jgi:flavodoxin I
MILTDPYGAQVVYSLGMIRTLVLISTSATGHTDYVVDTVTAVLAKEHPDVRIIRQRAELTKPEDMTKGDALILACGTWNTNNVEGQLSPYMHELLSVKGTKQDLKGIHAAAIGLGDSRYHFTARAGDRLTEYLASHNAKILLPTLKIINEPFDQGNKIEAWAKEFSKALSKIPSAKAA